MAVNRDNGLASGPLCGQSQRRGRIPSSASKTALMLRTEGLSEEQWRGTEGTDEGPPLVVPQSRVWERGMPYVVTEACIKCKYTDCVEVCPVDCFYEGENMLVINPDECIDCGVCEAECPAEAITPDTEPSAEKWLELNRQYSADADDFKAVDDKFAKFFSDKPGA